MPSRRWSFRCPPAALASLLVSPLRRHVRCLIGPIHAIGSAPWSRLPVTRMTEFAERTAHLDEFGCRIRLTSGMPPLNWLAKLTKLTLTLQLATDVPEEEIAVLMSLVGQSLVRQAPLIEEFGVRCYDQNAYHHPISDDLLTPLLHWPLKQLILQGEISPSTYPILRRMAHLSDIRLETQEQFVSLMSAEGSVPPLERIEAVNYFDATDEIIPLLMKLPTLRSLKVNFALADPTPLVPVLRRLHTFAVTRAPTCYLASFVSALQQATQLTDLVHIDHDVTEAHLAILLPPLRRLTSLCVHSVRLRSLNFLSQIAHLAETLTCLELRHTELEPTEVHHLRPLRALVDLRLQYCFTERLDADTLGRR